MNDLKIEVIAGLCTLTFHPFVSTGPDDGDGRNGVGFNAVSNSKGMEREGKHYFGSGVISHKDAVELRNFLEIYLKQWEQRETDRK